MDQLEDGVAEATQRKVEFEEEHGGDEGALNGLEGKNGITKSNVQERAVHLKDTIMQSFPKGSPEQRQTHAIKKTTFGKSPWRTGVEHEDGLFEELDILYAYLQLVDAEAMAKKARKKALDALYKSVIEKYPAFTDDEIKTLAVDDKWFTTIQFAVEDEVQRITQQLAGRVQVLEERYAQPLPELETELELLAAKVQEHLQQMGLVRHEVKTAT